MPQQDNRRALRPISTLVAPALAALSTAALLAVAGCGSSGGDGNSEVDNSFRIGQAREGTERLNQAAMVVHYSYAAIRFSAAAYDHAENGARTGTYTLENESRSTPCNISGRILETETGQQLQVDIQQCEQQQGTSNSPRSVSSDGVVEVECLTPRSSTSCSAGLATFTQYSFAQEQTIGDNVSGFRRNIEGQMDYLGGSERGEFADLSVRVANYDDVQGENGFSINFQAGAVYDRQPVSEGVNGDSVDGQLQLMSWGLTSCPDGPSTLETSTPVLFSGSDGAAIAGELKITDADGSSANILFNEDGSATVTIGDTETVVPRALARSSCQPSANL